MEKQLDAHNNSVRVKLRKRRGILLTKVRVMARWNWMFKHLDKNKDMIEKLKE